SKRDWSSDVCSSDLAVGALQDLAGGGARGSPCIERGRRLGVNGQGNGGTAGQDSAPALSPVRALEGAAREGSRIEGCGSQGIDRSEERRVGKEGGSW